MKFYERMNPDERETMIRKAVAFNVSLEGMDKTAQSILLDGNSIKQEKKSATSKSANDRTVE